MTFDCKYIQYSKDEIKYIPEILYQFYSFIFNRRDKQIELS